MQGPDSPHTDSPPAEWRFEATFDGGETGCGELILDLRIRARSLPPNTLLHVVARDPGAPLELPSWCRMTGHALVAAEHPHYLVRTRNP